MNRPIEINIAELILNGFSHADRHRIGKTVRTELARLFMEQGLPHAISQGGNYKRIDGGSFKFSKNMNARTIGNQIAQKIYGGLGK